MREAVCRRLVEALAVSAGETLWRGLAALSMLAAVPLADAAEFATNYAKADTRRWSCRLCEFDRASAQAGAFTAGAMESKGGEARFGRDNGIDRSGGHLDLNADYQLTTVSGWLMELTGRNLGLDSRAAALRLEKRRRYGLRARYRETPRNRSDDGRSPFVRMDGLQLPHAWVPAFSTSGMTQLSESGRTVKLSSKRRRSELGAWFKPLPALTLEAGYFHERKRGIQETSRDFLYQATVLPQPIDYRIEGADTRLRYVSQRLSAAISYAHRRFDNGERELVWDNPYAGSTARGRSATAPANQASTLSFVSRLRLHRSTRLNLSLARTEAKQNAPFVPYTSNADLDLAPIGEPGLGANRESLSAAANLVSRPRKGLRLSLAHGVVERTDRRRALTLTPVLGDLFATAPVQAVGYDYRRASTEFNLRYGLPDGTRFAAGFRNREHRRSNLEIAGNDERRGWLEASRELGAGWRLSLRHARGSRDASEFVANTANNSLTRRHYQAARREREWRGGLRFDSASSGLSVGLDANLRRFSYPDSLLGLKRDRSSGWLADVAHAVGDRMSLSGFFGVQWRKATTAGSVAFPEREWSYATDDRVRSAGGRLAVKDFPLPSLDLRLEYAHSDGAGDYATTFESATADFPRLISQHRSLDVRLQTAWRWKSKVALRYYYERYRAADWAIDGVGQDAIRNVLAFGRASPRYRNHLLAVSLRREL
ncbi:MAG: MtrB/PioB family decaheme-associated outer membrane protein [Gammaproteobacteria bacterium]|nr:MtrB/PioB family decaheme-associated outer membrane protein [Gammaproteobacteria bacterium]